MDHPRNDHPGPACGCFAPPAPAGFVEPAGDLGSAWRGASDFVGKVGNAGNDLRQGAQNFTGAVANVDNELQRGGAAAKTSASSIRPTTAFAIFVVLVAAVGSGLWYYTRDDESAAR